MNEIRLSSSALKINFSRAFGNTSLSSVPAICTFLTMVATIVQRHGQCAFTAAHIIRPASRGCNTTASVGVETANGAVVPPCGLSFKTGRARGLYTFTYTNDFVRWYTQASRRAHLARAWSPQVIKFGAAVYTRGSLARVTSSSIVDGRENKGD